MVSHRLKASTSLSAGSPGTAHGDAIAGFLAPAAAATSRTALTMCGPWYAFTRAVSGTSIEVVPEQMLENYLPLIVDSLIGTCISAVY
jgi:hypothetical protein